MQPVFIMHSGYVSREVEFVLGRERKGWKFYGRDHQGYLIPARKPNGDLLFQGAALDSRQDAAIMARALDLPAYAVWNGRKRSYDGTGAKFTAHARNNQPCGSCHKPGCGGECLG